MAESEGVQHFGSNEELVKYLKARCDDIEKAVIIAPGLVQADGRVGHLDDFQMVLHMVNGGGLRIGRNAAEMLLNDGLLNRLNIRIEFGKVVNV